MSGLPFLPGTSSLLSETGVSKHEKELISLQRTNFAKKQTLNFVNGVPSSDGGVRSAPVVTKKYQKKRTDPTTIFFDAYFEEAVHQSPDERLRVRKCVIHFFLDDETVSIMEPRVKNSGIPQGVLMKRHRVLKGEKGDAY